MAVHQLAYEVSDGGQGPYLLMVHGMLSSRHQWAPNVDALKPYVQPVLADLWGHGESPTPDTAESFEPSALVAQLEQIRAELGADRWLLCGQSLGAGLTMRYALAHPDHTVAQIFTNSISALRPTLDQTTPEQRSAHAAAIRAEGVAVLRQMHFHPRKARRLSEELRASLVEMADSTDPMAAAHIIETTSAQLSIGEQLEQIRCPTLLVNGGFERGFQPLRDLAEQTMPDCRVVDLEAGHAVNLEQPDAFNDAVVSFLKTINLN